MKKRVLSLILVCALCAALLPVPTALAAYSQGDIEQKLNTLMAQWCGKTFDGSYEGATTCKGFADMVYNTLFGTGSPGPYDTGRMYVLKSPRQTTCLGTLSPGSITAESVMALLGQAAPGDYVQSIRYTGTQHSLIVVSVGSNGITFFDSNLKGYHLCASYTYSWDEAAHQLSRGISLYRHTGYTPDNTYHLVFDAAGGTCSVQKKVIQLGAAYGLLPTPVRPGYRFDYWYTLRYGVGPTPTEVPVSASTINTACADTYLYAHWTPTENPCYYEGHTWAGATSVAPTCEEPGFTHYTCSVCGETYDADTIAPPGHRYKLVRIVAGDGEADGYYVYTCEECGDTYEEYTESVLTRFADVKIGAWYAPHVAKMVQKGYMSGLNETTFAPDQLMTRAMLVGVLHRMSGSPAASASKMSDVVPGTWYAAAVGWAEENDLVYGYPDGRFAPNEPLTREQMVAILMRYADYLGYDTSGRADLTFTDRGKISNYAVPAMQWAVYTKIISGVGNNLVCPQDNATRAQLATVLAMFEEHAAVHYGVA